MYNNAIKSKIDSNYPKSLKYINKAVKLDPNNSIYRNKQKQIEKRITKSKSSKIEEIKETGEKIKKSKDKMSSNSSHVPTGHIIIPNHIYWKDMYH